MNSEDFSLTLHHKLYMFIDLDYMEYRKIGETYYIRMDRDDEVIEKILDVCRKESIPSAVFSGIGGCKSAELQVFLPETGEFETEQLKGMLELVSLNGNVVTGDNGQQFHHTHALFTFKKDCQCVQLSVVLLAGSLTLRQERASGILKTEQYASELQNSNALWKHAFQRAIHGSSETVDTGRLHRH